ncbi:exonuclease [Porphyromonas crevioricanis JCM 15906]|uniref:Exonuclease n=1 Tax=Porphyromonas crevioricanis JCM 15906 TaxID=1305617 RepID=S4NB44_9PORP|nr:3'-5' exonuclease [Porphyromonas crevioricanis]GAD04460.1 exonuclease [Porphyromonas crevioricanis JCM 15906]SJZ76483.1 Exonuclease [Porphyromonas crevioricanis]
MSIWLLLATVAFGSVVGWILSEGRPRDRFGNPIYKPIRVDIDQTRKLRLTAAPEGAKPAVMIIDTETTGLPPEEGGLDPSLKRIAVIQLAWILLDAEGRKIEEHCFLLSQPEEEIPYEAEAIHHISTEQMRTEGESPAEVYGLLLERLEARPLLVAHNAAYHLAVLVRDMQCHACDPSPLLEADSYCTMESGIDAAHIIGAAGQWKYPKLGELFGVLYYGKPRLELKYSNKALADVRMVAAVYKRLTGI